MLGCYCKWCTEERDRDATEPCKVGKGNPVRNDDVFLEASGIAELNERPAETPKKTEQIFICIHPATLETCGELVRDAIDELVYELAQTNPDTPLDQLHTACTALVKNAADASLQEVMEDSGELSL